MAPTVVQLALGDDEACSIKALLLLRSLIRNRSGAKDGVVKAGLTMGKLLESIRGCSAKYTAGFELLSALAHARADLANAIVNAGGLELCAPAIKSPDAMLSATAMYACRMLVYAGAGESVSTLSASENVAAVVAHLSSSHAPQSATAGDLLKWIAIRGGKAATTAVLNAGALKSASKLLSAQEPLRKKAALSLLVGMSASQAVVKQVMNETQLVATLVESVREGDKTAWVNMMALTRYSPEHTHPPLLEGGLLPVAARCLEGILSASPSSIDQMYAGRLLESLANVAVHGPSREAMLEAGMPDLLRRVLELSQTLSHDAQSYTTLQDVLQRTTMLTLAFLCGRRTGPGSLSLDEHCLQSMLSCFQIALDGGAHAGGMIPRIADYAAAITELCISDNFKSELLNLGILPLLVQGALWEGSATTRDAHSIQRARWESVNALFSLSLSEAAKSIVQQDSAAMDALKSLAAGDNRELRTVAKATLMWLSREQSTVLDSADATALCDVFISFRFRESVREAKILKQSLERLGVRAYVCETQLEVGQDWATQIFSALESCKVMVVLGTETYGRKGMEIMATWEELTYALRYNKGVYICKMCDRFTEARTRGLLDNKQCVQWRPGTDIPHKVVTELSAIVGTSLDQQRAEGVAKQAESGHHITAGTHVASTGQQGLVQNQQQRQQQQPPVPLPIPLPQQGVDVAAVLRHINIADERACEERKHLVAAIQSIAVEALHTAQTFSPGDPQPNRLKRPQQFDTRDAMKRLRGADSSPPGPKLTWSRWLQQAAGIDDPEGLTDEFIQQAAEMLRARRRT